VEDQGFGMREGWQIKKVSEIAKHSLGKMLDKAKNKGEPKPYLRNLNVRWFDFDLSDVLTMPFLPMEVEKYTAVKGDVLVCEGGYPGRAAIWEQDEPIYFQKALHRVRFHEPERNRWFVYYLLSKDLDGTLKNHFNGAGIQHFTGEALAQFPVPLPPLSAQQRIVALLDEAFAGLATAKANAERNLQNARAIFASHLQSVFAKQWQTGELVTLADLATDITDGDHLPPPKSPAGVPFITIGNISKETREIDFTDTFMVARTYFDALKPHKKPRRGDVLYTVTGSFGIPVIVRDDAEFCFQRHIGLVRPKPETSSSWLYYLLMSPQLLKQANDGATGTAQKTVSLKLLRGFVVPKVSPNQQKQAVEKLNALSDETQRLTHLYERKLSALEELKKTLLHQAFNGEL
jgi:type I restriction enzyme, S subunit